MKVYSQTPAGPAPRVREPPKRDNGSSVGSRRSASPRMTLVQRKAAELVALAAGYGATRVSLCGSVARGEDVDGSDIDFYVNEFSSPGLSMGRTERTSSFLPSVGRLRPSRLTYLASRVGF